MNRENRRIDKTKLLKCVAIPLATGGVAGFLSAGGMKTFQILKKPPLAPPGWLFPVVWTILYVLMGIACYLVCTADAEWDDISEALSLYYYQLVVNFLWPIFFFNFQWYLFAFFWLVLLWVLVFRMIRKFYPISKQAAYLCVPYLAWLTFAGYLNLGIWWLNR